jgi:hypothetical protein
VDLGFQTLGNATLIVYDGGPRLVTDPWTDGPAYFGSWSLSHEVSSEQRADMDAAPFVWVSHGHPDHLSAESLKAFKGRHVLLPDHVGGRIPDAMRLMGHDVTVLPDRVWVPLSDRLRVFCLTDPSQDAILLIALGDTLIVNTNDTADSGWVPALRREVKKYPRSFLLAASGFGDIRGINYFNEDGERVKAEPLIRKETGYTVGTDNGRFADRLGVTHFVPFSSMHTYQRSDSVWANEYTTSLSDYSLGYSSTRSTLLPPYVRYDCLTGEVEELCPAPTRPRVCEPEQFGDDWSEQLSSDERLEVQRYFKSVEQLGNLVDFLRVRVGGVETPVEFNSRGFQTGLTFEVPRSSLLTAVRYEVFEDLLIGNFMRTTLHGEKAFPVVNDVVRYVGKYADNGRARTSEELKAYFSEYRRRFGSAAVYRHKVEQVIVDQGTKHGGMKAAVYRTARAAYRKSLTLR